MRHILLVLLLWPGLAVAACDGFWPGARDRCVAMTATAPDDCAAIARATHRLTCWDRLHRLALCPAPPGPSAARCRAPRPELTGIVSLAGRDRWTLEQEAPAFDETGDVFLSVPSERPAACGPRRRATLMFRCMGKRTAAHIHHGCTTPLRHPEGWRVDLRLDDGPIERTRLMPTAQGDGFGHFDGAPARRLIERVATARRLHLRFADIDGQGTVLSFPVAGLSDHLAALSDACDWSDARPRAP